MGAGGVRKRAKRWTRAEAKRELSAWRSSGLTKAAFARERGYAAKRLSQWCSRLGAEGWRPGIPAGEVPALVPVRVIESRPATSGPIEVELRNGVVVRVSPGFDGETFVRVLEVVGQC